MTLLDQWIRSLPEYDQKVVARELLDKLRLASREPEAPEPRKPSTRKRKPQFNRASPVRETRTRLEVAIDLDPDDLRNWLEERSRAVRSIPEDDDPQLVGRARWMGGWNNPISVYLRARLGISSHIDGLTLHLLLGHTEFVCPLPRWARQFVQACEAEPRGPIWADRALYLLQLSSEQGATA
jgi:hypothetical protein